MIMMMLILIILFLLSKTQNDIVLVITLSAKDNQKLSKLLGKISERSEYWIEYKKVRIKIKDEFRYFLRK